MNSERFAVEFDRRTVGIAVRVPGGFVFYAGNADFDELDGRVFPRARAIESHLKRVAGKRRTRPERKFPRDARRLLHRSSSGVTS